MIELATSRSRDVTAAAAASTASGSGHGVEPGLLGLDRRVHERPDVAGRPERPVLGQDQDEPGCYPASYVRHRQARNSGNAVLAGSRPLTISMYTSPIAPQISA